MPRFPKILQAALGKFPNVTSVRNIMSGAPCVARRRIPVWVIAGRFAAGESMTSIAADYDLKLKDVADAIRFTCYTTQLGNIKFWKFHDAKKVDFMTLGNSETSAAKPEDR